MCLFQIYVIKHQQCLKYIHKYCDDDDASNNNNNNNNNNNHKLLTNFMAYGTWEFNISFPRAFQ